jgi:hypothetical protein
MADFGAARQAKHLIIPFARFPVSSRLPMTPDSPKWRAFKFSFSK